MFCLRSDARRTIVKVRQGGGQHTFSPRLFASRLHWFTLLYLRSHACPYLVSIFPSLPLASFPVLPFISSPLTSIPRSITIPSLRYQLPPSAQQNSHHAVRECLKSWKFGGYTTARGAWSSKKCWDDPITFLDISALLMCLFFSQWLVNKHLE